MDRAHRPRVVIVGMGDTGPLVAVRLARIADVVSVTTKPVVLSGQELGGRLTDPEQWRRNYLIPFTRVKHLDRVRIRHGRVREVDPDERVVHVDLADGGATTEPYDALVVASGVSNGFWRTDAVEGTAAIDEQLTSQRDRIASARRLAVVGGGATGVSVATNVARTQPDTEVHLFHSGAEPLPGYHDRVRRRIGRELADAGVIVHPDHRAELPASTDRLTTEPITWSTGQEPFAADVVLWAVGRVRPHTDFLPEAMVDDDGFVRVDEHLAVPGYPGVFAVGDVAASDPHRSSARNWGYFVVARNIRVFLRGSGRRRRFSAPPHRWGSVLGPQADGLTVFQPDGRAFRVPRALVQPLLFRGFLERVLYRGLR